MIEISNGTATGYDTETLYLSLNFLNLNSYLFVLRLVEDYEYNVLISK